MQGVLLPKYVLYKDPKESVSYTVPQGTEIEIYRKVTSTPGRPPLS